MNVLDVLFTPLAVPPPPMTDMLHFQQWAQIEQPQLARTPSSGPTEKLLGEAYPWKKALARYEGRWINGFDSEFPELAQYTHAAFDLAADDVDTVMFLVAKPHVPGFWHSDIDATGLRFYLQKGEGDLQIVPTAEPHMRRPRFATVEDPEGPLFQRRLVHGHMQDRGAFFINNCRAIHRPIHSGEPRVVAAVSSLDSLRASRIVSRTAALVLRSAATSSNAHFWEA